MTASGLLHELQGLLAAGRYREVRARVAAAAGHPDAGAPGVLLVAATAAARLGEVSEGVHEATEALDRFRRRADEDGCMRSHNLLGALAFDQGKLAAAAERFAEAKALATRLQDHLMVARAANNLASVAHLQGRVAEARSWYREALLAYQRLGSRRGTAETYHNLALVQREEGDLAGAESAGDHAVRWAADLGEPGLLALALTGRAETAVERGEGAMAGEALARAEGLARAAGDEVGIIEADRVRALRWWKEGASAQALAAADRGRLAAARLGIALLEAECAALAGQALSALGRHAEAAKRRALARRRFRALGAIRHLERLEAGA